MKSVYVLLPINGNHQPDQWYEKVGSTEPLQWSDGPKEDYKMHREFKHWMEVPGYSSYEEISCKCRLFSCRGDLYYSEESQKTQELTSIIINQ